MSGKRLLRGERVLQSKLLFYEMETGDGSFPSSIDNLREYSSSFAKWLQRTEPSTFNWLNIKSSAGIEQLSLHMMIGEFYKRQRDAIKNKTLKRARDELIVCGCPDCKGTPAPNADTNVQNTDDGDDEEPAPKRKIDDKMVYKRVEAAMVEYLDAPGVVVPSDVRTRSDFANSFLSFLNANYRSLTLALGGDRYIVDLVASRAIA